MRGRNLSERRDCLTDATIHFTDNPTPPTSFTDVKPDDKCSRAEIVTLLYRGRDL